MTAEQKSIARQVWQEFSPRDGEELAFRYDGRIMATVVMVTFSDSAEGFDIDPDQPAAEFAAYVADRIQTIVMEERQQMVPDCPLHPASHPLQSDVVNDAAAWVCPGAKTLVRYMKVITEAV